MVLLAPAFGVYDTLSRQIGDSELEEWKKVGIKTFLPPGWEEDVSIPCTFMEDARRLGWPEVKHRTVILHGLLDDVVPIVSSRVFMRSSPFVEIVVVEDGLRLAESLELLRDLVSMVVD